MKYIGLFVIVFAGLFISRTLGFSDIEGMPGLVIATGAYILAHIK